MEEPLLDVRAPWGPLRDVRAPVIRVDPIDTHEQDDAAEQREANQQRGVLAAIYDERDAALLRMDEAEDPNTHPTIKKVRRLRSGSSLFVESTQEHSVEVVNIAGDSIATIEHVCYNERHRHTHEIRQQIVAQAGLHAFTLRHRDGSILLSWPALDREEVALYEGLVTEKEYEALQKAIAKEQHAKFDSKDGWVALVQACSASTRCLLAVGACVVGVGILYPSVVQCALPTLAREREWRKTTCRFNSLVDTKKACCAEQQMKCRYSYSCGAVLVAVVEL
jgi:hypothetical protein